ncbi:Microfibril-associated protein [Entamoeba marina]
MEPKGLIVHQIKKINKENDPDAFKIQTDLNYDDDNSLDDEELPVFVANTKIKPEVNKNEANEVQKKMKEEKREAGQQLVEMVLEDEELKKKEQESSEDFSSGDEYGGKEEFEQWQERELIRMKKEYLEQLEFEHDLVKLIEMNETKEETKEINDKKTKETMEIFTKVLSYGGEWDVTKGNWDFDAATGEDWMDKSLLPTVLQVKGWGKKGRVKHTHLTQEDTTYRKDE